MPMLNRRTRRSRSTTIRIVGSLSRITFLTSACVLFSASLLGAEASDDARAQASQSFREAKAAFARRDYGAAAAAFEQAAKLAPHPAPWLNAAEAWEKRGDLVRAAEDCDRALEVPEGDPSLRKEAEARLQQVLAHVGTFEVLGARSFSVRIDQGEATLAPFRRRVAPGAHRLEVTDLTTNRERIIETTAAAGEVKAVDLGAAPPTADPGVVTPSVTRRSGGPPVGTWILFGVGGAFAVATGVAGAMTLSTQSEFNAAPSQDALDRFRFERAVTNVFLGSALVAAGVGATIWILAPKEQRASVQARALGSSVDVVVTF